MNPTENQYLPVDAIFEMFNSLIDQVNITHAVLQSASRAPVLQHPKVSNKSKTGMGIIKSVRGRWALRESDRPLSSGNRQGSFDHIPKRSVDLPELGLTKTRNCHRVVVLGAPKVGKTNIIQRFLGGEFEDTYEPTNEDFYRKLFHIGAHAYQVDVLDAAHERDFPAKRRLSILTGDVFLLVFSVDDRQSFKEVCDLLAEIRAAKSKLLKLKHGAAAAAVPAVICANKVDLDAQRETISRSEVTHILGEDTPFFETSAKDGTGLEGAFRALAELGGLPLETSPSRHQMVSIVTYQSLCVGQPSSRGGGGCRRRRGHGVCPPCAAVDPLARRPSFTSDLRLVIGSNKHNKPERCQIQ